MRRRHFVYGIFALAASAGAAIAQSPSPTPWTMPEVSALPRDARGQFIRDGRDIMLATYAFIGPNVDDPAKRWKFQRGDLDVRRQWDDYQRAIEQALGATATSWAPWTVVPADSKTHRNLMIAQSVRDALRALDLRYPDEDPTLRDLKVE